MIKLYQSRKFNGQTKTEATGMSKLYRFINNHSYAIEGCVNVYCSIGESYDYTGIEEIVFYDEHIDIAGACDFQGFPIGIDKVVVVQRHKGMKIARIGWSEKNKSIYTSDYTHSVSNEEFISFIDDLIIDKTMEFYGKHVEDFLGINDEQEPEQEPEFLFGGDPEFELCDANGRVFRADYYIRGNSDSEIGCDGRSDTGEFRPQYGSPEQLANNIGKLFKQISVLSGGTKIPGMIGALRPLGGHIHISSPTGHAYAGNHASISKILDAYLGKYVIKFNGPARRDSSYGRLGDFRGQFHGGVEYRTPPAFIWRNPEILKDILIGIEKLLIKAAKDGVTLPRSEKTFPYNAKRFMGKEVGERYVKALEKLKEEYDGGAVFASAAWTGAIDVLEKSEILSDITFNDEWNRETKSIFLEALLKIKHPLRIHLFGYHVNRGNVISGFSADGFETITSEENETAFIFGIPWEVRVGKRPEIVDYIISCIIDKINSVFENNLSLFISRKTRKVGFIEAGPTDYKGTAFIEEYESEEEEDYESDGEGEDVPW